MEKWKNRKCMEKWLKIWNKNKIWIFCDSSSFFFLWTAWVLNIIRTKIRKKNRGKIPIHFKCCKIICNYNNESNWDEAIISHRTRKFRILSQFSIIFLFFLLKKARSKSWLSNIAQNSKSIYYSKRIISLSA